MINVAILLSTYNGEKFLKQQLDSILAQSTENWDLFIRDDGSKDSTLEIIAYYASNYKNIHFLKDNSSKGASLSFMTLLENVVAKYYMFCDQDDIWLPNKIEISLEKMQKAESTYYKMPILVHSDLMVVDDQLKIMHSSFWTYAKLKQKYLSKFNYLGVCNGVTGCTIIINNEAKEVSLPIRLDAPMHDYWMALQVAKTGKIFYVDVPTMLYRQHTANEVGAQNTDITYFLKRIRSISKTIQKQFQIYKFLVHLDYGSLLKFYWFKLTYTIIRNI